MNALNQLSRSDKIAGVSAVLLLIGLIAFPWYYVSIPGFTVGGQTIGGGSVSASALQATGAWAGVLALIVVIALLAELLVTRFLTQVQLPELPVSWRAVERYAAIAVLALLVIKFLSHIGNFGWGFYLDIVLAVVLVYGTIGLGGRAPAHASEAGTAGI
jgi:hypothetical protein